DLKTIHALEAEGGRLTDVLLTFRFEAERAPPLVETTEGELGPAHKEEKQELVRLAANVFTIDRFHGDPNIPSKKSDELYSKWVGNSLNGSADAVLVARSKGKVAGFITCKLQQINEDCKYGLIDLVAVNPSFTGKGVGARLIRSALNWFKPRVSSVYV